MKSWKEAPHLFANGKFYLKYEKEIDKIYNFRIEGFRHELTDRFLGMDIGCYFLSSGSKIAIKENHKLIARSISDMSDEELSECENLWHDIVYYHDDEYCISAKDAIEIDCEAGVFDTIIHLLSIGVYPFNQNHNDIIWRYENTNS